jgi:Mitochondrial carrier protein
LCRHRRQIQLQSATRVPAQQVVRNVLAAEGIAGFYRGFLPNAAKNLPNKGAHTDCRAACRDAAADGTHSLMLVGGSDAASVGLQACGCRPLTRRRRCLRGRRRLWTRALQKLDESWQDAVDMVALRPDSVLPAPGITNALCLQHSADHLLQLPQVRSGKRPSVVRLSLFAPHSTI